MAQEREIGWLAAGVLAVALAIGGSAQGSLAAQSAEPDAASASADWSTYRGSPHGTLYSTLGQINRETVANLRPAWTFDTGESFGESWAASDMQSNPLAIDGAVYLISPKGRLIKLDGATGTQIWSYDPAEGAPVNIKQRNRGLSFWQSGGEQRLFFSFRQFLFAINPADGKPIAGFGTNGRIDLLDGLGRDRESISVSLPTPPAVVGDVLVAGGTGQIPGHVRGFDARTGRQLWRFNTIPQPGEVGYETWPRNAWKSAFGANNWAGMSVDPARNLVFVPLASGGMGDKDFYGADRKGDNLFANSLVALDARTGQRVWHYQFVRHDVWDRDLPAPPTLITVKREGKTIDALAQITKSGYVFILDRATGKPLYPISEQRGIASDMPGEVVARRQPVPILPRPFARQHLTEALLTRRTPAAHADVLRRFRQLRSRGQFDPPSRQGTIILPGLDGGGEWGGASYDPETGLLYVNANEMAWVLKLKPRPPRVAGSGGAALYANNCAGCHGADKAGAPPEIPSLLNITSRLTAEEMQKIVQAGGGRMPAFKSLNYDEVMAIVGYVRTGRNVIAGQPAAGKEAASRGDKAPFVFDGYNRFLDPDGYPAIAPPWGTLSAIDVNTGRYVWKVPFGEYPELAAKGMAGTGSENYGGGIVTRGGLFIIAATVYDDKIRAFDKLTGKLLWQWTLPAAGNATPSTYVAGGRQFIVIPAVGGKNSRKASGSKVVAFALP
jgi:quinoprotein glucose dehydrogenase